MILKKIGCIEGITLLEVNLRFQSEEDYLSS